MLPQQDDSGGDSSPSEKNPITAAYEKFQSQTPAFTRLLIYLYALSWFLCLFLPPLVLDCTWIFMRQKFELYRIATGVFVNPDLFSNILAGFLLVQFGQRLEVAVGSSQMLWWSIAVFTLLTNAMFLFLQSILVGFSIVPTAVVWTSSGLWNIVLGLMAIEACRAAPTQPTRSFCSFWKIPTVYHPLAYLVLVGTFGKRSPVALVISTACGYALGRNASLLPMPTPFKSAADRYGRSTKMWMEHSAGDASLGTGETEMLLPTFQQERVIPSSSSSSGQALGGASHRNIDARTARLQALERNSAN